MQPWVEACILHCAQQHAAQAAMLQVAHRLPCPEGRASWSSHLAAQLLGEHLKKIPHSARIDNGMALIKRGTRHKATCQQMAASQSRPRSNLSWVYLQKQGPKSIIYKNATPALKPRPLSKSCCQEATVLWIIAPRRAQGTVMLSSGPSLAARLRQF